MDQLQNISSVDVSTLIIITIIATAIVVALVTAVVVMISKYSSMRAENHDLKNELLIKNLQDEVEKLKKGKK